MSEMSEKLQFPYTFRDLTEKEKDLSSWVGFELTKVEPSKRYCFSSRLKKYAPDFFNFYPRPDDIWLLGYPRSGTTLTQEILYILGTDLNYKKAASVVMDIRFPFLEQAIQRDEEDLELYQDGSKNKSLDHSVDELLALPHKRLAESSEKRFIKSHLGFTLLHPKLLEIGCKVVFIARNPKDVMVSNFFYPQFAKLPGYSFEKMWNLYKHDLSIAGGEGGNYFEMLKEGWERRNNKNMLFIFYEDVNADKRGAVCEIAKFLGKALTDEQLDKFVDHIDIKNFRNNKSLNNDHLVSLGVHTKTDEFSFIRKGGSGGWKENIPKHLVKEIDDWVVTNLKQIPGFEMPNRWRTAMELE